MYPVPTEAATQGRTDAYIASWLAKDPSRRGKIVLATKVAGASERITWLRDGAKVRSQGGKGGLQSLPLSLRCRSAVADVSLLWPASSGHARGQGEHHGERGQEPAPPGRGPHRPAAGARSSCAVTFLCFSRPAPSRKLKIHWPDRYVPLFGAASYDTAQERASEPIAAQLSALGELVQAGKVRAIGVSNETSFGVMSWVAAAKASGQPKIASIQNSYSLLQRGAFETDLTEVCSPRNANVGLLAYSPLAGGSLSGKYVGPTAPPGARFSLFKGYMVRTRHACARPHTKLTQLLCSAGALQQVAGARGCRRLRGACGQARHVAGGASASLLRLAPLRRVHNHRRHVSPAAAREHRRLRRTSAQRRSAGGHRRHLPPLSRPGHRRVRDAHAPSLLFQAAPHRERRARWLS